MPGCQRSFIHATEPENRFFIFDMFGTLVRNRYGNLDAVHDAFHSLYPGSDKNELLVEYCRYDRIFRSTHSDDAECSIDFIIRHMDGIYGTETDIESAEKIIMNDTRTFVPIDGAEKLLSYLKSHGYRIGVLSNSRYHGPAVRRVLEDGGLGRYVDKVLTSADIGLKKPNPESYRAIAGLLGAPLGNCFFAGDSERNDYYGPLAVRMKSAVFIGESDTGDVFSVPRIEDIVELFETVQ